MTTKCYLISKNCDVLFVYEGRSLIFRSKTVAAGHPALNEGHILFTALVYKLRFYKLLVDSVL